MKSPFPSIPLVALALCTLLACAEDRTYEYVEATQTTHWMMEAMQEYYLWGDSLDDLDWDDYFDDPEDFFASLTAQAPIDDDFSYILIDTLPSDPRPKGTFDHLDSYGIDYVTLTDPTGATTRLYARLITVYPNSPAEQCGLERGQFIGLIDDTKITTTVAAKLQSGDERVLQVCTLGTDSTGTSYEWTQTDTITLPASTYVEDTPFPTFTTLTYGNHRVAYLLCSRLTPGPTEVDPLDTSYLTQLQTLMEQARSAQPDAFVLDLRRCNDGTLDMAARLAAYLLPTASASTPFAHLIHRTERAADDYTLLFPTADAEPLASLTSLHVITSDLTQGAAEWLLRAIHAAQTDTTYLTTYGLTTAGQCVQTETACADYYVTLNPATAYVATVLSDASYDADYNDGIEPDYEIDEQDYVSLLPYGNPQEILLYTVLANLP